LVILHEVNTALFGRRQASQLSHAHWYSPAENNSKPNTQKQGEFLSGGRESIGGTFFR
jgi:hypothetical protein